MNRVVTFLFAAGVVIAFSGSAGAQVNCGLVNKQLQTGRSATEVAENLVISEDDVKKCQSQAGAAPGAPPSGAAGSPPTGAAGTSPSGAPGSPPTGATGGSSTGAQ